MIGIIQNKESTYVDLSDLRRPYDQDSKYEAYVIKSKTSYPHKECIY